MLQVIICIFIICIVIKFNKVFLTIFKVLNAIFKGLIWLICAVLEFILFSFILFLIYGEYKIILAIIATIVLNIILFIRKRKKRSHYVGCSGGYYSSNYVLNKKSGVIHEKWSESANTIKDNHKVEISAYDADKLVNRGTRYRYKK